MNSWHEYQRWNQAVASAAFPELEDPSPVYLDLDSDALSVIASGAQYEGEARDGLRDAVRGVTVRGRSFSLDRVWAQHLVWMSGGDQMSPPPTLALLALTVLAAEDMGSAGDDISPLAYYPRLCALLGLPLDAEDVRDEYQRRAEAFWGSLNHWLEELEGLRGTPTAYALRHRYVGLPMSQALVREGDRRKFPIFFTEYGLAPGMELAPEVLEPYLNAWFGRETCPASAALIKLWARPSTRERIASVAAVELMGWDGRIEATDAAQAPLFQRIGLLAQMRQGFMGSSLEIALTLRQLNDQADQDGAMEVEAANGEWLPLTFTPAVASLWRTGYSAGVDTASVLEGVVKIRPAQSLEAEIYAHHPRTIVPLIFDELQSAFLERERLQLNVDSMLLVRAEAKGRRIAAQVAKILSTCARPGFQVHEAFPGLPDDWVLISGVQLFGAPAEKTYNELVPLARDQLTVAGGLRIPSRVRKWSSVAPPEVRVSVESADRLRVVLTEVQTGSQMQSWTSDGGALVIPLDDAGLAVGDYRVALFAGDAPTPLQQATIRLRSADTVDPGWDLAARLTYVLAEPGGPLGAITAMENTTGAEPEVFIDGVLAVGDQGVKAIRTPTTKIPWSVPQEPSYARPLVQVGSPDPSSCVATGAHYLVFPPFFGGHQPRFIEGVCKYCGLVKRSPGWAPRKTGKKQGPQHTHVDVSELPPVEGSLDRLWDGALDALMHLGGGSASVLSAIASQLDGSALFTTAFPARLESLGHIAVERRPDGTPARWEISPTCLAENVDGRLSVTGFWPDALLQQVADIFRDVDGQLVSEGGRNQPTRKWFEGLDASKAALLLNDSLADAVQVTADSSLAMLRALPRLSQVAGELPRTPMPGYVTASRFDVTSASWLETSDTSLPGAYRLKRGFETIDVFRSEADVQEGLAARASVYLTKHLAANAESKTLVIYVPPKKSLYLPRGCDLPGLYARAIVVASGSLPSQVRIQVGKDKRPCLGYGHISSAIASLLTTLLTS